MDLGVLLDPRAWPQLLAAVLMLALAAGLMVIRWLDRVNRAFALFLVLRAFSMALGALAAIDPSPQQSLYWGRVNGYFHLAAFAALLAFVGVYPRRRTWGAPAARWTILGAMIVVLVTYARDKCVWVCQDPSGATVLGPAAAVPLTLALALAGLLFAREHVRAAPGPRRHALALVAAAFVVNGLFDGARAIGDLQAASARGLAALGLAPTPWAWASYLLPPLALPVAAAGAWMLARSWREGGASSARGPRFFLAASVVAVLSGATVGLLSAGVLRGSWGIFVLGLWRIAVPLVVTYAILRYQLFDIDLRVKSTIHRSAIVGVFGAAFFVGSQLLEKLIPVDGILLGIGLAALIALALKPIERMAHRLVDRMLPTVNKSPEYVGDRKLEVYRVAVESALEDGDITMKERSVLDRLRSKLAITIDEARRMEATLGMPPAFPPPGSTA